MQEQERPIPKIHDLASLSEQCQFNPLHVPVERDGLVSLTRFATRFRYPGEAATGEDARLAIKLMRRYRVALREFLGL